MAEFNQFIPDLGIRGYEAASQFDGPQVVYGIRDHYGSDFIKLTHGSHPAYVFYRHFQLPAGELHVVFCTSGLQVNHGFICYFQ